MHGHRCRKCAPVPEEVRRAADLLERRWLLSIVYAAQRGRGPLQRVPPGARHVPPRTLAARLVELEEAGVFERRVVDSRPPRVEYVLTDEGQRLTVVVQAMGSWAATR